MQGNSHVNPVVDVAVVDVTPQGGADASAIGDAGAIADGVVIDLSMPPDHIYSLLRRASAANVLATLTASEGQLDRHALPIALRRLHRAKSRLSGDARRAFRDAVTASLGFQVNLGWLKTVW